MLPNNPLLPRSDQTRSPENNTREIQNCATERHSQQRQLDFFDEDLFDDLAHLGIEAKIAGGQMGFETDEPQTARQLSSAEQLGVLVSSISQSANFSPTESSIVNASLTGRPLVSDLPRAAMQRVLDLAARTLEEVPVVSFLVRGEGVPLRDVEEARATLTRSAANLRKDDQEVVREIVALLKNEAVYPPSQLERVQDALQRELAYGKHERLTARDSEALQQILSKDSKLDRRLALEVVRNCVEEAFGRSPEGSAQELLGHMLKKAHGTMPANDLNAGMHLLLSKSPQLGRFEIELVINLAYERLQESPSFPAKPGKQQAPETTQRNFGPTLDLFAFAGITPHTERIARELQKLAPASAVEPRRVEEISLNALTNLDPEAWMAEVKRLRDRVEGRVPWETKPGVSQSVDFREAIKQALTILGVKGAGVEVDKNPPAGRPATWRVVYSED